MNSRKLLWAIVVLALCCSMCAAQQQSKKMTNQDVIEMAGLGLADEVIIDKIHAAEGTDFDTSMTGLKALKGAKVSDPVIRVMINPHPSPVAGVTAATAISASTDPEDPMSPHDPGVYLMTTTQDGKHKMVFIDRAGAGREKMHGGFFTASRKAEIPGPRAAVRTAEATPVFYMYFPSTSGIGDERTISSPAQFSLLILEEKKDRRETAVAKVHAFSGPSYGNDAKKTTLFSSQRIRPYAYKVTPSESLKPGEYAFIATTTMAGSGTGANVVIYDFGVDGR